MPQAVVQQDQVEEHLQRHVKASWLEKHSVLGVLQVLMEVQLAWMEGRWVWMAVQLVLSDKLLVWVTPLVVIQWGQVVVPSVREVCLDLAVDLLVLEVLLVLVVDHLVLEVGWVHQVRWDQVVALMGQVVVGRVVVGIAVVALDRLVLLAELMVCWQMLVVGLQDLVVDLVLVVSRKVLVVLQAQVAVLQVLVGLLEVLVEQVVVQAVVVLAVDLWVSVG